MGETKHKRWKVLAGNLLLFCVVLAVCIAVLEAAVAWRFGYTPSRQRLFNPHPGYLYNLRAGFNDSVRIELEPGEAPAYIPAEISEQGLRDRFYGPKAPGEFRILMMGDSFTFGWGLPVTAAPAKKLEALLHRKPDTANVAVINGGVIGYGPSQAHGFFLDCGLSFEADVLILQTFAANDLEDTLLVDDGLPLRTLRVNRPYRIKAVQRLKLHVYPQARIDQWLFSHSRVYYHLCTVLPGDLFLARVLSYIPGFPEMPYFPVPDSEARRLEFEPDLVQWYPELEESWRMFCRDILAFQRDCAKRNIEFIVYNIPYPFDFEEAASYYRQLSPGQYEMGKSARKTEAFFKDSKIPFVPLWEAFRAHPARDSLYFKANQHLNDAGAQWLAESLSAYLDAHIFTQTAQEK